MVYLQTTLIVIVELAGSVMLLLSAWQVIAEPCMSRVGLIFIVLCTTDFFLNTSCNKNIFNQLKHVVYVDYVFIQLIRNLHIMKKNC